MQIRRSRRDGFACTRGPSVFLWQIIESAEAADISITAETEEELAITVGAGDGRFDGADQGRSAKEVEGKGADIVEHGLLNSGVADDTAASIDLGFAGFELWFHERDEHAARTHERPDGREDNFERDEREVGDDSVKIGAG